MEAPHQPKLLVAKIFKAKYFPNGDILKAKLGSNRSYARRSIYNSLEVIQRGTRWKVGNGKMIHIWDDKWLPTPSTYKVISHRQDFNDYPMVSSLIDVDSKCWKIDLIRELFLPFEAETILKIPLSFSLPDDKIIWVGNRRGEFSIKSAYHIAVNIVDSQVIGKSSLGDVRALFWRKLWHLKLPAKIRIFARRACMNALPTMQNLRLRGVVVEEFCPLCNHSSESTSHALIHCEFVAKVWSNWSECPIKLLDSIFNISNIALELLNFGTVQDLEVLFSTA